MKQIEIQKLNTLQSSEAGILSVANFFPEGRATVDEIASRFNFEKKDLIEKMGLSEKPIATKPHEHPSYFAAMALERALHAMGAKPSDVGLVVSIGVSKDYVPSWSLALEVINKLKCKNAIGFDMSLGCASALIGLHYAKSLHNPKAPLRVIVSAERWSDTFSKDVPFPMVLAGHSDGGSACVVGEGSKAILGDVNYYVQAQYNDFVLIPGGGTVHPISQEVIDKKMQFRRKKDIDVKELNYVDNYVQVVRSFLPNGKKFTDEFNLFISNQIPLWMRKEVSQILGLDQTLVLNTFEKFGHAGACDLFLGIEMAVRQKKLSKGRALMFTSTPSVFNAMPLEIQADLGGIKIPAS